MLAMAIEPVVTVGNIVSILVTAGTLLIATWRLSLRIARLEIQNKMKIDMMWKQYCKDHDILNGHDEH